MSIRSHTLSKLGVVLLAVALAFSTTVAGAANQDPTSTSASTAVQLPVSGQLMGSLPPAPVGKAGNSFLYYKFHYDGNNRVVTINEQVYPDDVTILNKLGFVVYGPRTAQNPNFIYVTSGSQPKKAPNVSANLISQDAGDYLIQVFNDSNVPINFAIWADNLPPQPAPSPNQGTPAAVPSPAASAAPAPLVTPVPSATPLPSAPTPSGLPTQPTVGAAPSATPSPTGTPGGTVKGGGSFSDTLAPGHADVFQFDYPGDLSVYTINLQVYPDDPVVLQHAGFQVFTPSGALQVKGGAQPKLVPNVSGNVISKVPGTYTVKIYNDTPNTATISYTVSLVTGPPAKS
jgi:hypothetical protein